ncbi:hypothetical protein RISK_001263 [Rhodopirellula islandica]|uniref:Uncharacterized protein n=1 Tax=Rhodopirellula islandica TaxID=595434 RepID=A0A0J1EMD9_RHOIS|nr:hypothetical protein RISK_001263 [Rhodopirellula islandica]
MLSSINRHPKGVDQLHDLQSERRVCHRCDLASLDDSPRPNCVPITRLQIRH